MLYAKVTPVAQVVKQVNPFNTSTTTADHVGVTARPYALGASQVNFEVVFGNIVTNNNVQEFKQLTSSSVILTAAELANWGTDDTVALTAVVTKLNSAATLSDFITIEDRRFGGRP